MIPHKSVDAAQSHKLRVFYREFHEWAEKIRANPRNSRLGIGGAFP
jgi:hypothetical protein